jgi:hypothetical protein
MDAGLAVESIVDQGSKFTLVLPVRDAAAAAPARASAETEVSELRS